MRIIYIITFILFFTSIQAQNLVHDGSFEQNLPNQYRFKSINKVDTTQSYWYGNNTKNRWNPRKFHLDMDNINKLDSVFTLPEPYEGRAFIETSCINTGRNGWYLIGILKRPLTKEEKIKSSMMVHQGTGKMLLPKISMEFTSKIPLAAKFPYQRQSKDLAILYNKDSTLIAQKNIWDKVSGTYTAKGGEKYIIIGNHFGVNEEVLKSKEKMELNFYFLDDIEVVSIYQPKVEQKKLLIKRIYFENNSAELKGETTQLDKLGIALKQNRIDFIEILGYTNSIGNNEVNLKLSLSRAEAIKEYLTTKFTINSSKIKTTGMGEISGDEELSRKVEIVIH